MAHQRIQQTPKYGGLSTDTKQTSGILNDSHSIEYDTAKEYKFYDGTWYPSGFILSDEDGNIIDANHPLPTNGDSVYAKDVNTTGSSIGTFTGTVTDLFDDLDTTIADTSATNPKTFTIKLNRPINNTSVKFCSPVGSDFSNAKITLKDRSGAVLGTVDESGSSTKYTARTYDYPLTPWCTMVVEFHTADAVSLNWGIIEKSQDVHAILRAAKPDGHITDINATTGGNLKISVEEFDDALFGPLALTSSPSFSLAIEHYDEKTRGIKSIDLPHSKIHGGNHFYIKDYIDLINAQVYYLLLITENTTNWQHLTQIYSSEAEAEVVFYEAPTTSANGTEITNFNSNRNSDTTSGLTVYHTPTFSVLGTVLSETIIGSGKQDGGVSRGEEELILKQNEKYLMRVTNQTTSNNWFDYNLHWYGNTNYSN